MNKNGTNRYNSGVKSYLINLPWSILIILIYIIYLIVVISYSNELIPFIPGAAITDIIILLVIYDIYKRFLRFLTKLVHKRSKLHKAKLTLIPEDQCPTCNFKR